MPTRMLSKGIGPRWLPALLVGVVSFACVVAARLALQPPAAPAPLHAAANDTSGAAVQQARPAPALPAQAMPAAQPAARPAAARPAAPQAGNLRHAVLQADRAGASWGERVAAARALSHCRGFAQGRPLTLQDFGQRVDPRQWAMLQRAIEQRQRECFELLTLPADQLQRIEAENARRLSAEGSPLNPPRLYGDDGKPVSSTALQQAKLQLRDTLQAYGAEAAPWVGLQLIQLLRMQPAAQAGVQADDITPQAVAAAARAAQCRHDGNCDEPASIDIEACLYRSRCDIGGTAAAGHASAAEAFLTEAITQAVYLGRWDRLGL